MGLATTLLYGAVGTLVVVYFLSVQRRHRLARAGGCQPAKQYPHYDPILGLDLFFKTGQLFEENKYLEDLVRRYSTLGRTFQTNLMGSPSINTIEPENLHTIYVSRFKDWGVQPVRLPAQEPFCGRGFITTDGPAWEHSRALLKPSFNKSNVADLSMLENGLNKLIECIPTDGSTVDLQPLLFSLYLDTATHFLFGESFNAVSGKSTKDAHSFMEAFQYAMFGSGFRIALGRFKFLWRSSRWLESCRITHQFADTYVDRAIEYRKSLGCGNKGNLKEKDDPKRNILLYAMAAQTDDRSALRNEILQTLMAAQETTAVLISNVFFLLSRHPSVCEHLRQEILCLNIGDLDIDLLLGMKYLRNVLNEALRLYPVFPQMNRVALKDTILPVGGGPGGRSPIYVPAGTMFDTAFWVLHRLPSIWGPDAEEFKPDRWNDVKPGAWEYVPFGGGPRGCVGRYKALTEASYVIARILRLYSRIESRDTSDWTGQVQLTVKNIHGCKIAFIP